MGSLTVRKVDDDVMRDLRISAARRGVSMEQEARDRLRQPIVIPADGPPGKLDKEWKVEAAIEDILAFGRRLPKVEFDTKRATDELYAYLDEE